MRQRRSQIIALVAGILATTTTLACRDQATTGPEVTDVQFAKPGSTATEIVTFTFRDFGSDLIFGDGRVRDAARTTYTSDECGVDAWIASYGNATLRTQRYPIKQQESEVCGGKEGRVFRVSFTERVDTGDGLEWDGASMDAISLLVYDIRSIPLGETEPRKVEIAFDDQGGRGAGWGQACPWRLKFTSEWTGSSEIDVKRLGYDEWEVVAAEDDVAVCLGGKSEPHVLGYYKVPFQVNVVLRVTAAG
jgi:hypothetical protein